MIQQSDLQRHVFSDVALLNIGNKPACPLQQRSYRFEHVAHGKLVFSQIVDHLEGLEPVKPAMELIAKPRGIACIALQARPDRHESVLVEKGRKDG